MEQCKNCATSLAGPYCSQCGQKALTERITLRYVFRAFFEALTNLEQGFLFTMRKLMIEPGVVAREYLEGKRRKYYHPIRYLLILVTIVTLISLVFGIFDQAQSEIQDLQNNTFGLKPNDEVVARQKMIQEEVKKYLNLVSMATLPFIGLVAYLLFRKREYNYAEHLAMVAFWSAQLAVIGLLVQLLFIYIAGAAIYAFPVAILISSLYYGQGYRQVFGIGFGRAFWKGMLANTLGFALMIATIFIGTVIGVIIFVLISKMS